MSATLRSQGWPQAHAGDRHLHPVDLPERALDATQPDCALDHRPLAAV
ncbi:hypothetical protein [Pseudomonas sp. KNUC1026]|nr:hypothetical protein [Pseudomonas sp. KNUC1026]UFH48904.1 hypothetical protein LN139_18325 [Pseudomonas sp. KNUC1026]